MADKNKDKPEKTVIVAKNAAELQKIRLEKLMKNVAKPVHIPEKSKEYKPREPLEFIRNIWGSSAGAGSGDFHVYRGVRRREYARQKYRKEKEEKEEANIVYHQKVEENQKAAEERTAKKRAKRLKKKQKQKNKRAKVEKKEPSDDEEDVDNSDGDEHSDNDDNRPDNGSRENSEHCDGENDESVDKKYNNENDSEYVEENKPSNDSDKVEDESESNDAGHNSTGGDKQFKEENESEI